MTFRNVHFHDEQSGRPLLSGIDLDVSAGQTLAIVGPSGSGKTTLMALLIRFYDPQQGSILLDGRELRTLKQSAIRRNIGVVPLARRFRLQPSRSDANRKYLLESYR